MGPEQFAGGHHTLDTTIGERSRTLGPPQETQTTGRQTKTQKKTKDKPTKKGIPPRENRTGQRQRRRYARGCLETSHGGKVGHWIIVAVFKVQRGVEATFGHVLDRDSVVLF